MSRCTFASAFFFLLCFSFMQLHMYVLGAFNAFCGVSSKNFRFSCTSCYGYTAAATLRIVFQQKFITSLCVLLRYLVHKHLLVFFFLFLFSFISTLPAALLQQFLQFLFLFRRGSCYFQELFYFKCFLGVNKFVGVYVFCVILKKK